MILSPPQLWARPAPCVDHHGPVTLTEVPGFALASVAARRKGGERTTDLGHSPHDRAHSAQGGALGRRAESSLFGLAPINGCLKRPMTVTSFCLSGRYTKSKARPPSPNKTGAWCRFDLRGAQI